MDTAAPRSERAALARELLPALLHDLANTTQRLVGVRALLEIDDDALAGGAGADLAWAAERAHEQGWLMGLMSAALDVDVLLERRWPKGLGATLALVASALGRSGRSCSVQRSELPMLSAVAGAPRDSELCLALAEVVFAAGSTVREGALELVVERRASRWALCGSRGSGGALAARARAFAALPQLSLETDGESWAVLAPVEWFRSFEG